MVHTLVLRGPEGTSAAFAANRRARAEAGLPPSTTERFGYAALVAVGETEEEGLRLGEKLLWFLNTSMKSAPQFEIPARRRAAAGRADDLPHAAQGQQGAEPNRQRAT